MNDNKVVTKEQIVKKIEELLNEEKERIAECATCSYSSEEEINWNEGYWDGISDAGVAIVAMFKAEI